MDTIIEILMRLLHSVVFRNMLANKATSDLKNKLVEAYAAGSPLEKEYLMQAFGKKHLTANVLERVTNYDTACEELGLTPMTAGQFSIFPSQHRDYMFAKEKVITFIEAMKEGEKFDYDNDNQKKWMGWADLSTPKACVPGSGFSLYGVGYSYTGSNVGARQSCLSEAQVRHLYKCMENEMRIIMKDQ